MKRGLILSAILLAGFALPQEAHAWRFWGKDYKRIGLDDYGRPVPCFDIYRFGFRVGSDCDTYGIDASGPKGVGETGEEMVVIASALSISDRDNGTIDEDNTTIIARRKYDLDKSKTTGWWRWSCKDGSGSGTAPTKRAARQEGRANCNGSITLEPVGLVEAVLTFEKLDAALAETLP